MCSSRSWLTVPLVVKPVDYVLFQVSLVDYVLFQVMTHLQQLRQFSLHHNHYWRRRLCVRFSSHHKPKTDGCQTWHKDSPTRYLAYQWILGQKSRSQGQKVQKVATRQPCGAVSLRCDAAQQDGAARPAWGLHSIECPASSFILNLGYALYVTQCSQCYKVHSDSTSTAKAQ